MLQLLETSILFLLFNSDVPTMMCGTNPVDSTLLCPQTVTSMGGNLLCAVMEDSCRLSSGLAPALCSKRRVAMLCDRFVRVCLLSSLSVSPLLLFTSAEIPLDV